MKTILCYGDSNTWGMVPMTAVTDSDRHPLADRWPSVLAGELGPDYQVIAEGLNGRTTVLDDPVDGVHKNGRTHLLACLESHAPLAAVVLMLGTNDLKARFHLPAADIASGAGQLVRMITGEIRGQMGLAPKVLLVSPPKVGPLSLFTEIFTGAPEKSERLAERYQAVARMLGCHFLDAAAHVEASPVDGIHLDASQQRALGHAVGTALKPILNA
jgi:lysophospholipase L1-like esterase